METPFYIIQLQASKAMKTKDGLSISQNARHSTDNAVTIFIGMLIKKTHSQSSEQEQCMIMAIAATKHHGAI